MSASTSITKPLIDFKPKFLRRLIGYIIWSLSMHTILPSITVLKHDFSSSARYIVTFTLPLFIDRRHENKRDN